MCLCDINEHVGRHIDVIRGVNGRCRLEEFGRMNVIRFLPGEEIMCVKYMV